MEKEFIKLEGTLSRVYDLQENHLASFGKDVFPDLEKQSVERSVEIAGLMKDVSRFIKIAENKDKANTTSLILRLNDRVTGLLEQNKALETKVKNFKSNIKKDMKQISKGKQIIGSYRSFNAVSNNPKVISVKN